MTSRYRRAKNPGDIDCWLEIIGFYRKNVAYDETCLFRAIAEQVYCSQILHEKVRTECIEYGRRHIDEFEDLFGCKWAWLRYLRKLEVHMVVCGHNELELISKTYRRDIIVYDGINFEINRVTQNNYEDVFRLCLVSKDHYDVVYRNDYIKAAGFCQSIVYGVLYENVFGMENIDEIVNTMLSGKTSSTHSNIDSSEDEKVTTTIAKKSSHKLPHFKLNLPQYSDDAFYSPPILSYACGSAPFPYKIAKALDPEIYRNIAYDTWTEIRREMRLKEWYQGDDKLILGTCCELRMQDDSVVRCYIQEFVRKNEECVVYIPTLAEKKTVKYEDLSPEPNAKPWPLPYRFCKNVTPSTPPPLVLQTPEKKHYRKNKDRKQMCNGRNNQQETEINKFEGCPLLQNSAEAVVPYRQNQQEIVATSPVSTPQIQTPNDMCILSPYIYTTYPHSSAFIFDVPANYATSPTPHSPPIDENNNNNNPYTPDAESTTTTTTTPPPIFYSNCVDVETMYAVAPLPPPPPPPPPPTYEMMYPVYHPMPGTPIIYSPVEAAMPPPSPSNGHLHPIYTSNDVQFVAQQQQQPPSPFIYPPPPATPPPWYSPAYNSQGFIFTNGGGGV